MKEYRTSELYGDFYENENKNEFSLQQENNKRHPARRIFALP